MSKIMCDVCGTVFQDTAGNCPICGWIPPNRRFASQETVNDDFDFEDIPIPSKASKAVHAEEEGVPGKVKLLFADFQEMMGKLRKDGMETAVSADVAGQFSSPLVISLLIIIVLLLFSTGYLFFRYYLPNRAGASEVTAPTVTYETQTTTEESTQLLIPCTSLVLTSDPAKLSSKGQNWLIHVKVMPEDTTDPVMFISEDVNVATVSADGRVTAVGEGTTSVVITCGSQLIRSKITVDYSLEPDPVTATLETVPKPENTTSDTEVTTAPTTQATEPTQTTSETKPGIKLKLKRHDVSMNKGYNITLALDCDLTADEVTWQSDNPWVARVENGQVFAVASGTANITITYGDQTDKCIVRVR